MSGGVNLGRLRRLLSTDRSLREPALSEARAAGDRRTIEAALLVRSDNRPIELFVPPLDGVVSRSEALDLLVDIAKDEAGLVVHSREASRLTYVIMVLSPDDAPDILTQFSARAGASAFRDLQLLAFHLLVSQSANAGAYRAAYVPGWQATPQSP